MNKNELLRALEAHTPFDTQESNFLTQILDFVHRQDRFWQRSTLEGHTTGSAWIVTPNRRQALLIHHRKLNRWLQPGGHTDADDLSLLHTALREATEESGITTLQVVSPIIFDVDVHLIPEKGAEPAHLHYDVRFLLEAHPSAPHQPANQEIKNLEWVAITDLCSEETDESLRRMALKVRSQWDADTK